MTFEVKTYISNKQLDTKKLCSICRKTESLIKLPDNFQQFAQKKGFVSYFCTNCIQVVNFLH